MIKIVYHSMHNARSINRIGVFEYSNFQKFDLNGSLNEKQS